MQDNATIASLEAEVAVLRYELHELHHVVYDSARHSLPHGGRPGDIQWKLLSSTFVFLMQLGFAMIESGMCREVNVISVFAKNILDFFQNCV